METKIKKLRSEYELKCLFCSYWNNPHYNRVKIPWASSLARRLLRNYGIYSYDYFSSYDPDKDYF